jgi:hypothetical protein
VRVRALHHVGSARVLSGDRGGLADLERGVAIAVELNSPATVEALINLASISIELGDLARGFELQAGGRRAAERFGIPGWLRHLQAEQAMEDYWRGHWDAAVRHADAFLATSRTSSRHYMDVTCRLVRGYVHLARGDLPAALEEADNLLEVARTTADFQQLNPAPAFCARASLDVGDLGQAGAYATELLATMAQAEQVLMGAGWMPDLAVVLEALGRGDELRGLAADQHPTPWLAAAAAAAAGELERAADLCAEIGSLPDEAFVRLRAAGQLLDAGRPADAHAQLRRAVAFHRAVGAGAYLRQAEQLLAELASSA